MVNSTDTDFYKLQTPGDFLNYPILINRRFLYIKLSYTILNIFFSRKFLEETLTLDERLNLNQYFDK